MKLFPIIYSNVFTRSIYHIQSGAMTYYINGNESVYIVHLLTTQMGGAKGGS